MNFIAKYSLYKKMMKSSPQVTEHIHKPEEHWRRVKWNFDEIYSVISVHDLEYDWHTAHVRDRKTERPVAVFRGMLARRIFNHLEKSL